MQTLKQAVVNVNYRIENNGKAPHEILRDIISDKIITTTLEKAYAAVVLAIAVTKLAIDYVVHNQGKTGAADDILPITIKALELLFTPNELTQLRAKVEALNSDLVCGSATTEEAYWFTNFLIALTFITSEEYKPEDAIEMEDVADSIKKYIPEAIQQYIESDAYKESLTAGAKALGDFKNIKPSAITYLGHLIREIFDILPPRFKTEDINDGINTFIEEIRSTLATNGGRPFVLDGLKIDGTDATVLNKYDVIQQFVNAEHTENMSSPIEIMNGFFASMPLLKPHRSKGISSYLFRSRGEMFTQEVMRRIIDSHATPPPSIAQRLYSSIMGSWG